MGIYTQEAYNGLLNNHFNVGYIEFLNTKEEFNYFKNLMVNLSDEISEKINLFIVSSLILDDDIQELTEKFNQVHIYKNCNELKNAEEVIKLGIVPSIKENFISDSTIEFIKRKIPVIAGNKGGDSLFCDSDLFVFNVDELNSFEEKLTKLISKPKTLNEYWSNQTEVGKKFIEQELMEEYI